MPRVLIADDHACFREPIRALLQSEGYAVDAVADGVAALAALGASRPDLVLLDMRMPGMDGSAVLAQIRHIRALADLPVIIMTMRSDRQSIMQVARLGVSAYLLKDHFSLDRMLSAVRSAIDGDRRESRSGAAAAVPAIPRQLPAAEPEHPADGVSGTRSGTAESASVRQLLRSIEPIASRAEIMDRLAGVDELRGLSPAVSELLSLTASPSCTIDAVASAIGRDQGIALRIMRLANSTAYSRGAAVDSVRRAVVQIGLRRIRLTILALGVVERFSAPAFQSRLDTGRFWEHSLAVAVIAAEITRTTDPADADAAFIAGLLHDVGRVLLAEQLGDLYVHVLDTAADLQLPLEQVETRMLSVNHADLTDTVLRRWDIPESLVAPIADHHRPLGSALASGGAPRVEGLRLIAANRLAHALMIGSSGNEAISPTLELFRSLQIGEDTLARISSYVRRHTDEMRAGLLTRTTGPGGPGALQQYRELIMPACRPLLVGENPGLDAHCILCQQLARPPSAGPPTVAVTYAPRNETGPGLAGRLAAAEQDAGTDNLPVVILSPQWEPSLDLAVLGHRAVEVHKTPLAIPRLIGALNRLGGGPSPR